MEHMQNSRFLLFVALLLYLNESNFFATCQSSLYTKQEVGAIRKLRPKVAHLLTLDYHKRDGYLLRFIRGNNFDLEKAFEALEKAHQWRKENSIDSLDLKSLKVNSKYLPCKVEGHDRNGRPILLLPFGKWKLRNYVIAGRQEDALRQFRLCLETGIRAAYNKAEVTGQDIDQYYIASDFDGYNTRDHLCLGCVPLTLSMGISFDWSSSFLAHNVTLVNCPRIFQPILSVVRNALQLQSLQVVNDYNSDRKTWQPLLHKDVEPDQLPKSLGGTLQD